MCGHATLATAFVLMTYVDKQLESVKFETKSGLLTVSKSADGLTMDFPIADYKEIAISDDMVDALGVRPIETYLGRDLMMVLDNPELVENYVPDLDKLSKLPGLSQCITAKGRNGYDCVSRMFAPKLGVPEDPVTGSSHCMIAPYRGKKLGKDLINAYQASARGGNMNCHILNNGRIELTGNCVLYSKGELFV